MRISEAPAAGEARTSDEDMSNKARRGRAKLMHPHGNPKQGKAK
jgi:hypothetical protein